MLNYEVVVIGAGLAGSVAALKAARGGAKVALIAKGPGATAISGGAIDICGSPIYTPGLAWSRFLSVKDNIYETISRMPHHPYSILALNHPDDPTAGVLDMLAEAAGFLKDELARAGLVLEGDSSMQKPAPTMLGTWKLTSMTQGCQQLGAPRGETAVCGIKGLSAPDADALASCLQMTLAATGLGSGESIESLEIELEGRQTWTMEEAAEHLERPGCLEGFIELISKKAGEKYRTVLIPPVLPAGLKADGQLTLKGGGVIREMLATPPSTPGRRLQDALSRALESAGVCIIRGAASEFERNGNTVVSCIAGLESGKRVHADKWVLATGKFIAGGLRKERAFRETAIGLPVFCSDSEVNEIYTPKLLNKRILAEHPAFGVGLTTDLKLRPLDRDGKVIFKNLMAAGSILGGYNYHTGACGLGVCLLTGYRAGTQTAGEQ